MVKVNRVAVALDEDEAIISLYKTNTKLAEFGNYDIDVPPYDVSGLQSKSVYQQYCKDVVINLLENGGIEGFYYEEKQQSASNPAGKKYGTQSFETEAKDRLVVILNEVCEYCKATYQIRHNDNSTHITERYKSDHNVKFGSTEYNVTINKGTTAKIQISVVCEIRSGQMCKPKVFTHNSNEYRLNAMNVKRLLNE